MPGLLEAVLLKLLLLVGLHREKQGVEASVICRPFELQGLYSVLEFELQ